MKTNHLFYFFNSEDFVKRLIALKTFKNNNKEVIFKTFIQFNTCCAFRTCFYFPDIFLFGWEILHTLKHAWCPVDWWTCVFRVLFGFVLHIRGSNIHVLLDFCCLFISLVAVNVYAFPTFASFGFFFVC